MSPARAWLYLVWLSFQRQARARQMVWIALALLVVTINVVAVQTAGNRWNMNHFRFPRGGGPTFRQLLQDWTAATNGVVPGASGIGNGILAAVGTVLEGSGFIVFANFFVYSIFLSCLLPVWSLSFATEAIGSERESREPDLAPEPTDAAAGGLPGEVRRPAAVGAGAECRRFRLDLSGRR